jgi:SSS family solute:Na+ symporter
MLPVFIFVLPGLMAYVLAQKGLFDISSVQHVDATGKTITETKGIYTLMITQLVPTGLVGILVAALLSGLMSQISGHSILLPRWLAMICIKGTGPKPVISNW